MTCQDPSYRTDGDRWLFTRKGNSLAEAVFTPTPPPISLPFLRYFPQDRWKRESDTLKWDRKPLSMSQKTELHFFIWSKSLL